MNRQLTYAFVSGLQRINNINNTQFLKCHMSTSQIADTNALISLGQR